MLTLVKAHVLPSLLGASLLVMGCVSSGPEYVKSEEDGDIVQMSHAAADALIQLADQKLSRDKAILAASFVNIDDLEQTTTFGRIVSQQLVTQFSKQGFEVIEMLLRKNIYIKQKGGEFLLSRAVQEIGETHDANAVIVGTYAVGKRLVYITVKIIDSTNSTILASFDYKLPIGPDTRHLLRSGS